MNESTSGEAGATGDHRYSPPRARVRDPEKNGHTDRPPQIVVAVVLIAVGYGLNIVRMIVNWDLYARFASVLFVVQPVSLLVIGFVTYKVYQGRNWARWALLVLTACASYSLLTRLPMRVLLDAPMMVKVDTLISLAPIVATWWLLFISRGRKWFRRGEARGSAS